MRDAVLIRCSNGKSELLLMPAQACQGPNYQVQKQEFMTFKWTVKEKYNDYLFYLKLTVYTDKIPSYTLTHHKNAEGHRKFEA